LETTATPKPQRRRTLICCKSKQVLCYDRAIFSAILSQ
jgi:hypothetical protein